MYALRFSTRSPNDYCGATFYFSVPGLANWTKNRITARKYNYIAILISSSRPVVTFWTVEWTELIYFWRVSASHYCRGEGPIHLNTHTHIHTYLQFIIPLASLVFCPQGKAPAAGLVRLLCCCVGDINEPRRRLWSSLSNFRAYMHVRPVFRTILHVSYRIASFYFIICFIFSQ